MTKNRAAAQPKACYCGNKASYLACCARYHLGEANAPDASSLMRSRYSAYVLGLEGYLRKTWASEYRPASINLNDDAIRWLGLDLIRAENLTPKRALVEFVARYKVGGRACRLGETSQFELRDGQWFYLTGTTTG